MGGRAAGRAGWARPALYRTRAATNTRRWSHSLGRNGSRSFLPRGPRHLSFVGLPERRPAGALAARARPHSRSRSAAFPRAQATRIGVPGSLPTSRDRLPCGHGMPCWHQSVRSASDLTAPVPRHRYGCMQLRRARLVPHAASGGCLFRSCSASGLEFCSLACGFDTAEMLQ